MMNMAANPRVKDEFDDINPEVHQSPIVHKPSTILSDGCREESPSPRHQNKWTIEQRLTLIMLAEGYTNNWVDLIAVFNYFHKSDLRRGGLRRVVVQTQYFDMTRKGFDADAAVRALNATLSPFDRAKLVTRTGLEKKAREIGISLSAKGPTDGPRRSRIPYKHDTLVRKRKVIDPIDDARTDYLPDDTNNEDRTARNSQIAHGLTLPTTPSKIKGKQVDNGLMTPPATRERKKPRLAAGKRLAQIGFRAVTAQSQGTYTQDLGIRAGAFVHSGPSIPRAQDLETTRYRQEALHHITYYDHTRPSMFISATKNPMRALHMLLHAPEGEKSLILIDLNAADDFGNVQKANNLQLRTKFRYSGAGEYLIFGGVDRKAIISCIPLSRILTNMPTTPDDNDPFRFAVLQAHKSLSLARYAIRKELLPMTYSLGRAVGQLVGILQVPPTHFESGIWAFCQDYKFYNAEGGKRVHWADNSAFKHGAMQGYQATRPHLESSLEIEDIIAAKEIIEISDDSETDDDNNPVPMDIEEWIQNTQDPQSKIQHYDLKTGKWITRGEEDLSEGFFTELRDIAANSDEPQVDGGNFMGTNVDLSRSTLQDTDMVDEPGFGGLGPDMISVIDNPITVPPRNTPEEFRNLNELCADVMHMHRAEDVRAVKSAWHANYEFSWTGM